MIWEVFPQTPLVAGAFGACFHSRLLISPAYYLMDYPNGQPLKMLFYLYFVHGLVYFHLLAVTILNNYS